MNLDLLYDKLNLVALPFSIISKSWATDTSRMFTTHSLHIYGLCPDDFSVTIAVSSNKTNLRVVVSIPGCSAPFAYTLGEDTNTIINKIPGDFFSTKYIENIIILIQSLDEAYHFAYQGGLPLQSPFEVGVSDDNIAAAISAYNDNSVSDEERLRNTFKELKKAHSRYKNDRFFMGFYNSICGRLNKLGIVYYDI